MVAVTVDLPFSLLNAQHLDVRKQFNSIEEMKNYSEKFLPPVFISSVIDEVNGIFELYLYNKNNPIDDILGKWRKIIFGGSDLEFEPWVTNKKYKVGQYVYQDYCLYKCNKAHDSTDFLTDRDNWDLIIGTEIPKEEELTQSVKEILGIENDTLNRELTNEEVLENLNKNYDSYFPSLLSLSKENGYADLVETNNTELDLNDKNAVGLVDEEVNEILQKFTIKP